MDRRPPLSKILSAYNNYWGDDVTCNIRCPICGFEYQHCLTPQVADSQDSYEAHWGGRGDLIVIPVWGECGSEWEMCFGFHKGVTGTFVRLIKSCKPESYVYFIEAVGLDKIKIGTSDDPEKRLKQLATGSAVTLELKVKISANIELEKELHKKFEHLRVDKEWFYAAREIREYINKASL